MYKLFRRLTYYSIDNCLNYSLDYLLIRTVLNLNTIRQPTPLSRNWADLDTNAALGAAYDLWIPLAPFQSEDEVSAYTEYVIQFTTGVADKLAPLRRPSE